MRIIFDKYTHIGNRPENEDSCGVQQVGEQKVYAIVADGLGGHGGGRIASQTAVEILSQCGNDESFPTQEQIFQWLCQANDTIIAKRDGPNRMKTTVVFMCVCGNQLIWAHIGDSRLYHFYNGQFVDVTMDHSMTQIAVLQGEITRKDMPHHPDRSRLIRAMGSEDFEPTIHPPVQLAPGHHAFFLCSDGVWETLQEEEIMLDLHAAATPGKWIEALRFRSEKRRVGMSHIDNNTAVALFLEID